MSCNNYLIDDESPNVLLNECGHQEARK